MSDTKRRLCRDRSVSGGLTGIAENEKAPRIVIRRLSDGFAGKDQRTLNPSSARIGIGRLA